MPFLNCGKGGDNANHRSTVSQINEGKGQREYKQKRTRDFVHHTMDGHEPLLDDKARDNIDDFDEGDNAHPNVKPNGHLHNGQQLHQTNGHKDKVHNRIQLGAQRAGGVCFSRHPTIHYVGKAGGEVKRVKCWGKCGTAQERQAAQNADAGDEIGQIGYSGFVFDSHAKGVLGVAKIRLKARFSKCLEYLQE